MNRLARQADATTLSEELTYDLAGQAARLLAISASILLAVFLSGYTAAQWLAGEKFLRSAFELDSASSLAVFGLSIVFYSSIGGFRGSVSLICSRLLFASWEQSALVAVFSALSNKEFFWSNLAKAGDGFLQPFPSMSLIAALGFIFGFAFAAIGFGLGQPQIVTRYFAASSPAEAKAARWIYIGFIQFTWISMAAFGVVLRGVMPESRPGNRIGRFRSPEHLANRNGHHFRRHLRNNCFDVKWPVSGNIAKYHEGSLQPAQAFVAWHHNDHDIGARAGDDWTFFYFARQRLFNRH